MRGVRAPPLGSLVPLNIFRGVLWGPSGAHFARSGLHLEALWGHWGCPGAALGPMGVRGPWLLSLSFPFGASPGPPPRTHCQFCGIPLVFFTPWVAPGSHCKTTRKPMSTLTRAGAIKIALRGSPRRTTRGLLATLGGPLGGLEWLLGIFGVAFGGPWKTLGRPRGALQSHREGNVDFHSCRCSNKAFPKGLQLLNKLRN